MNLTLSTEEFVEKYGRQKSLSTYTLGCKVNQYDTEAVVEKFIDKGYEVVKFDEVADVYIVNTCTVTHLSDRKCRQMLRKTKKINPNSILIAMGCYAQSAQQKVREEVKEVDIIVGTNRRSELVEIVEKYNSEEIFSDPLSDIMEVDKFEELTISSMNDHTRVYLKIQEGCNNYCTYCIIPYVRGKIRSRQPENVLAEAVRLTNSGFKEIILTGIHVASYGKDLKNTSLIELLAKLDKIDKIDRIRTSSIEPIVVTNDFINVISNSNKICKHFHLSLQSGSDSVLQRMKRKYTTSQYLESVSALRKLWPDVAITTDIIVGFPGETEEEFQETITFIKKVEFAQIHLFPYSPREGTVAAKMENQVSPQIKEERLKIIKEIELALRNKFLDLSINETVEVLFETSENGKAIGYTSNYLKVEVPTTQNLTNQLRQVKIIKRASQQLEGSLLNI